MITFATRRGKRKKEREKKNINSVLRFYLSLFREIKDCASLGLLGSCSDLARLWFMGYFDVCLTTWVEEARDTELSS